MRSSLATALIEEGNDYATVQQVLGHDDIRSAKAYVKVSIEQLRPYAMAVPAPSGYFKKSGARRIVMQAYIFESVLKEEFNAFFSLRRSQGIKDQNRFIWEYLDKYLVNSHVNEKAMTPEKVEGWISSACIGLTERSVDCFITSYNAFAKFLISVGIPACIYPHASSMKRSKYIPYIFSDDEMEQLFIIADSGRSSKDGLSKVQFPLLLPLLYGCGLRLGEAVALQSQDIDFDNGTVLIRSGKGNKDRLVPMDESLTTILRMYCAVVLSDKPEEA